MRSNRAGPVGIGNAAVVGALALLPFAAVGCAEDTADEDTAAQQTASVEDDAQHEYFGSDQFVGDDVIVSAVVTEVLSAKSFVLDGSEYGDESLLVLFADGVEDIQVGDVIKVTGMVGEFVHADYREEYGLLDQGVYDLYADEEFLLAQSIQTSWS